MAITIEGMDGLIKAITDLATEAPEATADALHEEGEVIFNESQQEVPVDEGHLRASGYLTHVIKTASGFEVEMGYTAEYALPVHERLDARHPVGKARYLADPFDRRVAGMAERLAEKVKGRV